MSLFDDASPKGGFPSISHLPWLTDVKAAQIAAHELLVAEDAPLAAVACWLRSLEAAELDYLLDRSTERSSHYKWCLGGHRHHYLVWLHQYKPPATYVRADRWAKVIHDHRYSFSSRVLSGALHVSRYRISPNGTKLPSLDKRVVQETGSVVTLFPDEVHCIDSVENNTCTLVIQGPAARHSSTIFHLSTQSQEHADDLDLILSRLVDDLPQLR
jgi:hypothetical protein